MLVCGGGGGISGFGGGGSADFIFMGAGIFLTLGSAKTDPVRFKRGFREGLLKDQFAFSRLLNILYLRVENCLQNAHFCKQQGPCLKRPLSWTGSTAPLPLLLVAPCG